jgi:hypothetical protein
MACYDKHTKTYSLSLHKALQRWALPDKKIGLQKLMEYLLRQAKLDFHSLTPIRKIYRNKYGRFYSLFSLFHEKTCMFFYRF